MRAIGLEFTMTVEETSSLTVAKLKALCILNDLSTTGKKSVLVERLLEFGLDRSAIGLSEKKVSKAKPSKEKKPAVVEEEFVMSLEDSLELLSLSGQAPEEDTWISFFKLKPLQIHTPDIDITSMADEVIRRINEESHPQLFISSSAFRNETTSFEDANTLSGKRSANVFIRLKKMLSSQGYKNKVDYTFLPFEIKVVTDSGEDSPDYVTIHITSSPQ